MNAPDRFETFMLPDGHKKIEILGGVQGLQNSCVFKIEREDHTIGNMLRVELQKNPKVKFVGYKMPHPLQHYTELYIQAQPGHVPSDLFHAALASLISTISTLKTRFEMELLPAKARAKDNMYKDQAPALRYLSKEVLEAAKRREENRRLRGITLENSFPDVRSHQENYGTSYEANFQGNDDELEYAPDQYGDTAYNAQQGNPDNSAYDTSNTRDHYEPDDF